MKMTERNDRDPITTVTWVVIGAIALVAGTGVARIICDVLRKQ